MARDGKTLRRWQSPPATLAVKQVCERCNSGWMSRTEVEVEPVLRPLLRNAVRTLSTDDQRLLSFWALKTATACDLATQDPAAPDALRRQLVDAADPPAGLVVLIARYAGSRHPLLSGGWVRSLDVEIGGSRTTQRMLQLTVTAGPVVFQVFGHGLLGLSALQPAVIKRDFSRVIWPASQRVYWPLPMALGDEGLHQFARDP